MGKNYEITVLEQDTQDGLIYIPVVDIRKRVLWFWSTKERVTVWRVFKVIKPSDRSWCELRKSEYGAWFETVPEAEDAAKEAVEYYKKTKHSLKVKL